MGRVHVHASESSVLRGRHQRTGGFDKKLYKEYKDSVRDFLSIDSRKVIPFVREVPERGKDWNEQLLREQEESLKAAEEVEETRSVASGIDLDADGDIEINESEEKKRFHFNKR